jgi:hypothetical protein
MVQVAMFDAINSVERRYRPYLVQLPATTATSREAAAAAAAAAVLAGLHPQAEAEFKAAGAAYLATLPDSDGKAEGIKLGEAIGAKNSRNTCQGRRGCSGFVSAADGARRLHPNTDHGLVDVAKRDSVCNDEPVTIPTASASRSQ